jgi:hypothetical protein
MYDGFISYSRSDLPHLRALERSVAKRRLRIFVDRNDLRAGESWPQQLGDAIQRSRLLVLCWSANANRSDWLHTEIRQALTAKVPIVPWLLDDTPLPASLQQTHAIATTDPGPVVDAIERAHARSRQVITLKIAGCGAAIVAAVWFGLPLIRPAEVAFHGHVMDEQRHPIPEALVEASGRRSRTSASGEFVLELPRLKDGAAVRVSVTKPGYINKTIDTLSDVPDLGVVLEKEE